MAIISCTSQSPDRPLLRAIAGAPSKQYIHLHRSQMQQLFQVQSASKHYKPQIINLILFYVLHENPNMRHMIQVYANNLYGVCSADRNVQSVDYGSSALPAE